MTQHLSFKTGGGHAVSCGAWRGRWSRQAVGKQQPPIPVTSTDPVKAFLLLCR